MVAQPVGQAVTQDWVVVTTPEHVLLGMTVVFSSIQSGITQVAVLKYGHGRYAVEVKLWQVVHPLSAGPCAAAEAILW